MDLIFDTHALIWFGAGDSKFSARVLEEVRKPETRVFVSAVTAWEYRDLQTRGYLPGAADLAQLRSNLDFALLDLPGNLWTMAEHLPDIHRDPVDRMLVAHAQVTGFTLATADRHIRQYPVETIW